MRLANWMLYFFSTMLYALLAVSMLPAVFLTAYTMPLIACAALLAMLLFFSLAFRGLFRMEHFA